MTGSYRVAGALLIVGLLVVSAVAAEELQPADAGPTGSSSARPAAYSGVTGYVYANTDNYVTTTPLAGAQVTVVDDCVSLESMSCSTVGTATTNAAGFFGMNLTSGSGYYAVVSRDSSPKPAAPEGFGGAVQGFTAPDASPLEISVYPYVPYGNATIVLPGYDCLSAYVDNLDGGGPGCQNPVLSWSQDGAYYVNVTDQLVFYSFVNESVYRICNWTPLYQGFPDYPMIPNDLFSTQDGSYLYSWGEFNSSSGVVTVEAVNVTTHRVFLYNYTSFTIGDEESNGNVLLTGWDGNDSQAVLIDESGQMVDHDLWSSGESIVRTLPFFEGNNIYWEPYLNGFINVEAAGSSGDYVQELQLTGPVASSSAYVLTQTYLGQWTTAGVVVNGVNGVSFNVTSRELSVQAENSGLVYSVSPDGAITNLLLVTNLNADSECACVSIGPASESDRPALFATGPEMSMSYNGYVNDSWLTSMVPGNVGFYSTNVSPFEYNFHATTGTVYTWGAWYQEGQFVNTSYLISQVSYACGVTTPGTCTINGSGGAAVGTIWWLWKLGLPEFPYPSTNPIADDMAPAVTDVTSVSTAGTSATLDWNPPGDDAIVNYTVAWGTSPGVPTGFASVPGSTRSYTIAGLVPSTRYYDSVVAWNLHYHGTSTGVSNFVTLPEATDLEVTGTGITNVSLAWTNPAAGTFTNNTVEYGTSPGALSTHLSVGLVSSDIVTGLQPSTQYYFAVVTWNGSVEGSPSNIVGATTSFVGATDLTVTGVAVTDVSLAWSNPAAGTFTNLTVEYGTTSGVWPTHLSVGLVSSYTVTGLRPSTQYYFEVVAWNGSVEGSPSNIVSATTSFVGATDLVVTGVTPSTVSLTWSNPSVGTFTNITVEYGTTSGVWSARLSVGPVPSYTVTGLRPSTQYYFEVVAWNGTVEGTASNVVNATTSFVGAMDLKVTGYALTNVSLAWTNPAPGTFTNVTVEFGLAPQALTDHRSVGAATAYTVTGLAPSTTYYFEVVAWNATVEGTASNNVSATTSFVGVTDLRVTGYTLTNVSLAWMNPSAGAFTNLSLEYGTTPSQLSQHQSVGKVSESTVEYLRPSTKYYFEVLAWNGSVEGTASNVVNATTSFVGVTGLIVAAVYPTSVVLGWYSPPAGTFTNLTVEYGLTPEALTSHLSVGVGSAYTVIGLASSTTYYFQVVAWNGSTVGTPSNMVSATTTAPTPGGGSTGSAGPTAFEFDVVLIVVGLLAIAVAVLFLLRRRGPTPPPNP